MELHHSEPNGENNLDDRVNQLETKITNLIDKHAPLKVFKINPMKINWLTEDLKGEIEDRNKIKARLDLIGGSPKQWRMWKKLRKKLNKKLKMQRKTS